MATPDYRYKKRRWAAKAKAIYKSGHGSQSSLRASIIYTDDDSSSIRYINRLDARRTSVEYYILFECAAPLCRITNCAQDAV